MTTDELLTELSQRRIGLSVDSGKLRFRAPAGSLTPELRGAIAGHRTEIIRRLQAGQDSTATAVADCVACARRDWIDEPARDGRIRTHCGKCGRFIGYRRDGGK